jgi:glycosyltransferase involved in cell wall biosynthesis
MQIAILGTRGIPARYGGFETFAEQLSARLVLRGHKVTVFCEACKNPQTQHRGANLRHMSVRALGPLTTVVYDAECLWQARSGFDVVYMLGYGSSALCWLPRLWGSQVWINMDGLEWTRAKWGPVARSYLRIAESIAMHTPNRIIADAMAIKMNLQARHSFMPPCDVIPYGCEIVESASLEALQSFGLTPGSYYLVVCRFEPENHLKEIIEGFLKAQPSRRLVLVGDHARKDVYPQSLAKYKNDCIAFTGPVYDAQKVQALRYFCHAYLHGHSVGGTNPSLLEAMGCGNLILAHDNCFNREVLGSSAFFFSTSEDVCECIVSAETGLAEIPTMKRDVVNRVRQFYTWERITDHYCELLDLACSKSGNSAEVIDCAPLLLKRSEKNHSMLGRG